MEFCITILVREFEPRDLFQRPYSVSTPWGEAVRSSEVGKYFFRADLHVQPIPEIAGLRKLLPSRLEREHWLFLTVGGAGLESFERDVNFSVESREKKQEQHPFLQVLRQLLREREEIKCQTALTVTTTVVITRRD